MLWTLDKRTRTAFHEQREGEGEKKKEGKKKKTGCTGANGHGTALFPERMKLR